MKYIIIGGVAGGATAAARLRRIDENAQIVMFEKGKYISYANCGLPYYIGGEISDRDKLFLQTPGAFGKRFAIDVRTENEITEIRPDKKEVLVRLADGSFYTESYDQLLLSPGASPLKPAIKGIDSDGIFTLRNVSDTDRIKSYVDIHNTRSAIVVGGGFIGLEMAENLALTGHRVTVIDQLNQVMAPLDYSMASLVHQHLNDKGVDLLLGRQVKGFRRDADSIYVDIDGIDNLKADIVILSIGVRPETALAKGCGLKIGETGGIWVDSYMRTSNTDIYAVGDAVEFPHPITGQPWMNYLAGPANRQARIAADNMAGLTKSVYEGSIGTSVAKVFDMTVAASGLSAKRLKQAGIEYCESTTHSGSHAGYYPGALQMSIRLIFDPSSGRIYGAQAVGFDGVDKRIDLIAVIIKNGGTLFDLMSIEHAYAPPYSSAKDPVAIAGYVAGNILNNSMPVIYWRQMRDAVNSGNAYILDVRSAEEFSTGNITGAINIPVDELRERLNEIPSDRQILIYCAIGQRGMLAQRILLAKGFDNVLNLSGGYKLYVSATSELKPVKPQISDTRNGADECADNEKLVVKVDACGLQCPGPILKVKENIDTLTDGQRLEVISTDPAFLRDVESWCNTTGHRYISGNSEKGVVRVILEKSSCIPLSDARMPACNVSKQPKSKTLIMFSDDLDKALATFVLANGAAATGAKVTIFFTFWGLNVIKKSRKPVVKKDIFGRMFSMMLPSDSLSLKLSKMNMMGIGSRMMRFLMKKKGISSLEQLREDALKQGVEFIACQMSMDVMGVDRAELIDEATIGGVATYMDRAESANVNLFI